MSGGKMWPSTNYLWSQWYIEQSGTTPDKQKYKCGYNGMNIQNEMILEKNGYFEAKVARTISSVWKIW